MVEKIEMFLINVDKVKEWFLYCDDPWVKTKAQEYIIKGVLPMIYKYTKGLHTLFFIDEKNGNQAFTNGVVKCMWRAYSLLREKIEIIGDVLGIRNVEQLMPDEEFLLIEKFKNKDKNIQIPFEEMEQDELVYGEMYTFRKLAEIIMRVIEKVVPERLAYEISSYQRPNAIKRNKSQTFKDGKTTLEAKDSKFSISFAKFKQSYTHSFSNADEEEIE